MSAQNKNAFTLIELLVVITIIAILAVIGFAMFGGAASKAKDAKRRSDIDAITKAFETNYDPIKGVYSKIGPENFTGNKIPTPPEGEAYDFIPLGLAGGPYKGFRICAKLQVKLESANDRRCNQNSAECYCKESSQGEKASALASALTNEDGSFNESASGISVASGGGGTGGGGGGSTGGTGGGTQGACVGCSADINGDGNVNSIDDGLFNACYNKITSDPGCKYVDLNGDNVIDNADDVLFNAQYNKPIQKTLVCENFGDVNLDGKLTIADVRTIKDNYLSYSGDPRMKFVGHVTTFEGISSASQVSVTLNDASHLQQFLNNQITTLAACQPNKSPACEVTGVDGIYKPGDVSTDGKVTWLDYFESGRLVVGGFSSVITNQPFTNNQILSADVHDPANVCSTQTRTLSRCINGIDSLAIANYFINRFTGVQACPKDPPCFNKNGATGGMGDVDNDGKITDQDRYMIAQFINPGTPLTDDQKKRADVDGNGSVEQTDASRVRSYLTGFLPSPDYVAISVCSQ